MGWLGITHTFAALTAIPLGAAVLLRRKGDRIHRRLGQVFVALMVYANLSSFGLTRLFGRFGIFHLLAVVSLLTILAGFAAARWRVPKHGWRMAHYYFMIYGYAGLIAASLNEFVVHVRPLRETLMPHLNVYSLTGLGAFLVMGITWYWIRRDVKVRFPNPPTDR